MLNTKDLRFAYNAVTGFQFPDLYCPAGDTLLITGASGKGKTTLLHLLAGLLQPSAGSIQIGLTDITTLGEKQRDRFRGKHIGIVFQQAHFVHSLSVQENILLSTWFSGNKEYAHRLPDLMQLLNLDDQAQKKPSRISQGQLQRASIARAVLPHPSVILADEPTSSLDDDHCHSVAALLQNQAVRTQAALVIVTHDQRLKNIFKRTIALS